MFGFTQATCISDDNRDTEHFDSANRWTGTSFQRHVITWTYLTHICLITMYINHLERKFLLMAKMFSKAKTFFRRQLKFPVQALYWRLNVNSIIYFFFISRSPNRVFPVLSCRFAFHSIYLVLRNCWYNKVIYHKLWFSQFLSPVFFIRPSYRKEKINTYQYSI